MMATLTAYFLIAASLFIMVKIIYQVIAAYRKKDCLVKIKNKEIKSMALNIVQGDANIKELGEFTYIISNFLNSNASNFEFDLTDIQFYRTKEDGTEVYIKSLDFTKAKKESNR
ncbi:MAG: hypothetical protein GY845_25775 [Planctomycetes bacterium]|nr:hypothetical protein [Planctomycetota bacterium]